jgi:hypothetical protein
MLYVYVNKGSGTLHKAMCEDCNVGQGKGNTVNPKGKWLGPFETLEEIVSPEVAKLKPCRKCRPDRDW